MGQGFENALLNLAYCIRVGDGCDKDWTRALRLYRQVLTNQPAHTHTGKQRGQHGYTVTSER